MKDFKQAAEETKKRLGVVERGDGSVGYFEKERELTAFMNEPKRKRYEKEGEKNDNFRFVG